MSAITPLIFSAAWSSKLPVFEMYKESEYD